MARNKDYLINRIIKAFTNDDSNKPNIFRTATLNNTPESVNIGFDEGLNIYGYFIYNPNVNDCFVRIYDKTVPPTVGTDISVTAPILVPGGGTVILKGTDVLFNIVTGAWVASTTGYSDSDISGSLLPLICEITFK